MSKRRESTPPKEPRQCLFCERNAGSPEHLWSQWMAPFFNKGAHDIHEATWHRHHPDPHPAPQVAMKKGHPTSLKIKAVCKPCNTIWMSQLEGRVSPFMKLMMVGDAVALGEPNQLALAEWVALKMMVLQRADNARDVIDEGTRRAFRADRIAKPLPTDRALLPNLRIWLFHAPDPRNASVVHRDVAVLTGHGPAPGKRLPYADAQAVLLGVGQLLIYATQTTTDEEKLEIQPDPDWGVTLWPRERSVIVWPPPGSLSFADVEYVAKTFARYMAKKTPV